MSLLSSQRLLCSGPVLDLIFALMQSPLSAKVHINELDQIPVHADWINFLRNHDELSLAYLQDPLLSDVKNALMKYGEPFREEYGISGRTYSFLGRDEQKLFNAYFLVASLPGGVLIPYGDGIGKT